MKRTRCVNVWVAGLTGILLVFATGCGGDSERSETPEQRTIMVEKTVERTVERTVKPNSDEPAQNTTRSGETTTSDSISETAGEAAPQSVADISCEVGQACDLGESVVTVTGAERAQNISTSLGDSFEGDFIIVEFDYTYGGNTPVDLGEPPFRLLDDNGNEYSLDFDSTVSYEIDNDRSLIYETVQPGVSAPGTAIFQVSPEAGSFTLLVSDLASPQANASAEIPLPDGGQTSNPTSSESSGESSDSVNSVDSFVSFYYDSVAIEDWLSTYSMLDAESQAAFTADEWVQKQTTRNASAAPQPLTSATVNGVSEAGQDLYANVTLTYSDGSQETLDVVLRLENGEYRRHLTAEEISFLQNL